MPAGICQPWVQFGSHCWNELNQTEHVAIACVQSTKSTMQANTEFRLDCNWDACVMSSQPFLE